MMAAQRPPEAPPAARLPRSSHAAEHGMHLDPHTREEAVRRLRSAKGHLEGILRMLDDPAVYCVDVLKQIKAVQGALSKVNESILRSHVRDHVATAAQRGDTDTIVDELMEALKYRT